jgi:hypothetical protein
METKEPIHRADDELRDMLDEHGTWVVHGHNQQVFGVGRTLRHALDRATRFAHSGAVVVAVTRMPPNRIFVLHDQIVRIVEWIQAQGYVEDERVRLEAWLSHS